MTLRRRAGASPRRKSSSIQVNANRLAAGEEGADDGDDGEKEDCRNGSSSVPSTAASRRPSPPQPSRVPFMSTMLRRISRTLSRFHKIFSHFVSYRWRRLRSAWALESWLHPKEEASASPGQGGGLQGEDPRNDVRSFDSGVQMCCRRVNYHGGGRRRLLAVEKNRKKGLKTAGQRKQKPPTPAPVSPGAAVQNKFAFKKGQFSDLVGGWKELGSALAKDPNGAGLKGKLADNRTVRMLNVGDLFKMGFTLNDLQNLEKIPDGV
eukprot:jgi/Bigna1/70587/fgenesh1_pg.12_\